ncbi:unnamed protein product [Haemonchus placei]|uniref:G_PROTEIN_RECEP_F1_2 domain-containing protein n=1 Tax=Haemonchus placei TaxID=6290 RepID=A0A0N4VYY7_HAEPC|nr:unnamed protein product [Haemonchus placei]
MRAANVALVVVIPLVFLVVLNSMLMYYVKKRSFFPHESLSKVTRRMQREGQAKLPFVATLFRRHSDQLIQQKMEHRVAVTVCAVVTSFTITQVIFKYMKNLSDPQKQPNTTIFLFLCFG